MVSESPLRAIAVALVLVLIAAMAVVGGTGASHPRIPVSGTSVPAAARPASPAAADRASDHPSAAGTLTVVGSIPTAVSLSWTESTAFFFTNYTLQQSSDPSNGPWTTIAVITTAASTSYVATDLAPSTGYGWRVIAGSLGGSTDYPPANATTPATAYLNVTVPSPTTADLSWTNNATYGGGLGFVSYGVYETAATGAPVLVATETDAGTRAVGLSGLSPGASYGFYVNTTDCDAGCGGADPTPSVTSSNVVTVGTPEPLSASLVAERPLVDVGQPDLLSCSPSGGRSPYQFAWSIDNGSWTAGGASRSLAFNATGPAELSCQVTDAGASQAEAATVVSVDPALGIRVAANRTSVDVDQAVGFACTASGGAAPVAVQWTFGDGGVAGLSSASHAYDAPGVYVADCVAADAVGSEAVGSLAISVSASLIVSAASSANAAAPGTVLSFQSTVRNGTGSPTSPSWNFGDGQTGQGLSVTHAFVHPGIFLVTVRSTDAAGETSEASVTERISAITVNVTGPVAGLTGQSLAWTATAAGGAGAPYTFAWSVAGGGNATGTELVLAFHAAATYHPVLVVSDRLGARTTVNLAALTVRAPPTPAPPLWIPIAGGVVAFGVVTPTSFALSRREEARSRARVERWVPPTDPRTTFAGAPLLCRNCGTPNSAVRGSCAACGQRLGGTLRD